MIWTTARCPLRSSFLNIPARAGFEPALMVGSPHDPPCIYWRGPRRGARLRVGFLVGLLTDPIPLSFFTYRKTRPILSARPRDSTTQWVDILVTTHIPASQDASLFEAGYSAAPADSVPRATECNPSIFIGGSRCLRFYSPSTDHALG